jgi:2-octaprenyl-6-methoxyphenol hydroxylase
MKREGRVECLIVGGGLTGGALATALTSAGIETALVERADPVQLSSAAHDGRASAIAHASHKMLGALGLWGRMVPHAESICDIRVSDGPSLLSLHYDHRDVGDEPLGYIVENRAIRLALQARLSALPQLEIIAPASVQSFTIEAGEVDVRLGDGRALRTNLLIAADGSDSHLRRQMDISATEWRYPQTAIVCTMGHDKPHRNIAHERFLPAGPFAVLPMTDDPVHGHRSSIVWAEQSARAPMYMALSDAAFSLELHRRFGPSLGDVRLLGGRWSYPLRLLHAESYIRPRFALVGDAAHTMHPIAGQGLNMGLRDVAALAEVLIDAKRLGLDLGALSTLERYQRWRRFDNQLLLLVTDGLNRLFSNESGALRLVRDLGMAAVDRMTVLKRLFMRHAMGTLGETPRLLRGEAL